MNKIPIKRHIATKIFLLILTGYIFVTILLTSIYMINQYDKIKQRGFNNQEMLVIALAPSLGLVTFDGDLDQLESLLNGIIKSQSIFGISYSDITNTMNVSIGNLPDINSINENTNIDRTDLSYLNKFEIGSLFGLSGNIIHNNRIVGKIIISSSKTIIIKELKSVILIIIFGMLLHAFLLWIFFRWVSMVYLHRRLTGIINGLNQLEPTTGKFTPLNVDIKEEDEIYAIQKSFNLMAEKLQITHNKINSYNKELEQKVHDRTLELEKISITDRLTGLFNRHKTDDVLENEIQRSSRFDSPFSLILIDIDNFKLVNDNYGHQIGDKVLIETANLLVDSIRNTDILGRWGGEEFLIIVPETQLEGALLVAETIRLKIEKHKFPKINSLTISLGVSSYKKEDTVSDLISRADSALYLSKENGKNQIHSK